MIGQYDSARRRPWEADAKRTRIASFAEALDLAKAGSGWRRLLSAELGSIAVLKARNGGYANLELSSLGMCVHGYRWNGANYVQAGSHGCATTAPPTMGTLPRAIRGR